jgi:hypothetical protein
MGKDVQAPVTKSPLISTELQDFPSSAAMQRSIGAGTVLDS